MLWADALCINQNDSQAQSDQARMIALVYNGAQEVIAWLGEEDDDTKIAMETCRELGNIYGPIK